MDSLSAPIRRGPIPWQGLLLAVSLLNFWSLPTTAQFAVLSKNAVEGNDVMLHTRNAPPDVTFFIWYKGKVTNHKNMIARRSMLLRRHRTGPANSGREEVSLDGSLLIKKVIQKDTGDYTLVVYLQDYKKEIRYARLNVYERLRAPTILHTNLTVVENKGAVILACCTNADSTQWFFNGMNLRLTERMKLSLDNNKLIIDPVKREDAGKYHCVVSNLLTSAKSLPVELDVKY